MKTTHPFKFLAGLALAGCATVQVSSANGVASYGPASFALRALSQDPSSITYKTNHAGALTNVTATATYKTETKSLSSSAMLKLLTNSLPALGSMSGAKLVVDDWLRFYVVTPTSTNSVASVLRSDSSGSMYSGSETKVLQLPHTLVSEKETLTATMVASLVYDDTSLTTGDGKHTRFTFNGLGVVTYGDATTSFTTAFTLTGQGVGTIEDTPVILSGTVTGHVTGKIDTDDFH